MHTSPYDRITHRHLDSFPATIEGNETALFCVVSTHPLSQQAHDALVASAGRLEYSPKQICFITLTATDAEGDRSAATMSTTSTDQQATTATTTSADQSIVTPRQLLEAIEAIDPLCVVLTDRKAVETASAGYNAPLSLGTKELLLGRGCCCFEDFGSLLESEKGKRTAWNCLRTLPTCFG
ncbi:MAG: hypothetical protein U0M72_00265 [Eggerthellaceae bacterium]